MVLEQIFSRNTTRMGPAVRGASLLERRRFELPVLFALLIFRERLVSQEISTRSFPENSTEKFSPTRFIGTDVPKTGGFRTVSQDQKTQKGTGSSNHLRSSNEALRTVARSAGRAVTEAMHSPGLF
jgi:hypothetical protein